ncbi:MAG: hypothetical protein HYR91_15455 [Flavobacteriia bacterium]|nr:hypothetical protein [Flavobacteriia bacterium]
MKRLRFLLFVFIGAFSINEIYAQNNIMLLSPSNNDTIHTPAPLLTWSYMGAIPESNDRAYYRLILVELQNNQSAEAGIIVNQPLVKMDNLQGTQLFYPFDAPELKPNIWYGWQIQKIVNNVIADKSEAFRFILEEPKEPLYLKYVTLKKQHDGVIYEAINGKVFFKMDQGYQVTTLKATIYNDAMEVVQKRVKEDTEEPNEFTVLNTGTNFFELDLGTGIAPGIYVLEVFDAKKQKYLLKFKVSA